MAKVKSPKTGISSHVSNFKYPPIKLTNITKAAENKIPYFLWRKLPLTSLGELQKAPKQSARPISKCPHLMESKIGTVTAMAIKMALEKLVLFKK